MMDKLEDGDTAGRRQIEQAVAEQRALLMIAEGNLGFRIALMLFDTPQEARDFEGTMTLYRYPINSNQAVAAAMGIGIHDDVYGASSPDAKTDSC